MWWWHLPLIRQESNRSISTKVEIDVIINDFVIAHTYLLLSSSIESLSLLSSNKRLITSLKTLKWVVLLNLVIDVLTSVSTTCKDNSDELLHIEITIN